MLSLSHTALGANALVFLHIAWSVLWFSGWGSLPKTGYLASASIFSWIKIAVVLVTHMLVAGLVSFRPKSCINDLSLSLSSHF